MIILDEGDLYSKSLFYEVFTAENKMHFQSGKQKKPKEEIFLMHFAQSLERYTNVLICENGPLRPSGLF